MQSNYKQTIFDSGLKLVTVPMEGVSSVTVLAMVGVGSRYETEGQAGIAHFLEHMVFKGTANYPTAMDISSNIDGVGGQYNAFTGKDYTGYYTKVASEHLELGLDVISDMLLTPRLREEDIDREKGVIVEEMNMYEDDPRRKIDDVYDEVIFGNSDLGRQIIGRKKTVRSFKRSDFQSFLDDWYSQKNVVVVIAGDSQRVKGEEKKVKRLVEEYFSKGDRRKGGGKTNFNVPTHKNNQVKVVHKTTEQAHFYLGFTGLPRDSKDKYSLAILSTVLGGNSSARLFNEIREKRGLAYYAYASTASYVDTGSIFAFEGVDPTRVEEAILLTVKEFMSLGAGKIENMEVSRAKEYIKGKLILDWEDSQSVALTYAKKAALSTKVETPDDILKGISEVTEESVKKLAKKLFVPGRMNLALIGPYRGSDRFEKLLK